jgi:hypothetical protein
MLDNDLKRSWEEEADEARDRKELKREIKMNNRWRIIVERAISFATTRPITDFNFKRCRSQSC